MEPRKLTPRIVTAICKRIANGSGRFVACRAAGVTVRGLANAENLRPDVAEALKKAEAQCEAALAANITQAAKADWRAAAFLLERKFWKRWSRRSPDQITPAQFAIGMNQIAAAVMPFVPAEKHVELLAVFQSILNDPNLFHSQAKRPE